MSAPYADWFGQEAITVEVRDPGGLTDTRSIPFTVTPVNDPPVASLLPNQSVYVGGAFLTIALDEYVTDVDNDVATMFWTYSGNTDLMVNISGDRIATVLAPSDDWVGVETITFSVTDQGGLGDETHAEFEVRATPLSP